jgi:hypothetical protein
MRFLSFITLALVFAQEAAAQRPIVPDTFGTASSVAVTVGAADFKPINSQFCSVVAIAFWHIYNAGPSTGQCLWAQAHVPSGARLESIDIYYRDTNPTSDLTVYLYASYPGQSFAQVATVSSTGSAGTYGTLASTNISPPYQWPVNGGAQLAVQIDFPAIDGSLALQSVVIHYRLQVRPAPATATFADVPDSHPFFQYIEALAASGITAGCAASPPQYCPDAPITRGQMAVFLSRALGLHWPD